MSYASVDASDYSSAPRPMLMRMEDKLAASATMASPVEDFAPSKITLTAHVNVLFQLK